MHWTVKVTNNYLQNVDEFRPLYTALRNINVILCSYNEKRYIEEHHDYLTTKEAEVGLEK